MFGKDLERTARRVQDAVRRGYSQKDIERILEGDYIPGGERVTPRDLVNVRDTDEPEARCCTQTGNDIQSGPIYCGRPAVKVADVIGKPGAIVCFCQGHFKSVEYEIKLGEREREKAAGESLTASGL